MRMEAYQAVQAAPGMNQQAAGAAAAHESSFGGAARREEEGEWGDTRREEYLRSMRASTEEQFPGLQFGREKVQQGKQVGFASDPYKT